MKKLGFRIAAGAMAATVLQGALWGTAAGAAASDRQPALSLAGPIQASAAAYSTGSSDNRTADASGVIQKAIQATSPSVVAIIGRPSGSDDDSRYESRFSLAHGTGVVVGENGLIVTNAHVVKDMDPFIVVTSDGKQYPGRTTHLDVESDLALVQIDATGLKPATFADSSAAQVGDTVIAIGTPIAFTLRNSATVGVISGLDRSVNSTYRLLQTDASINPGNSGGPLVNTKGEVIGINSLKVEEYGVDNLGFAIPSDTVRYVLDHFKKYGKVRRPFTGLELEESWAAVVGIPSDEPLAVGFVEKDSPADKAGIKAGDKLLSVDNHTVKDLVEFNELLKKYLPGDHASFSVQSDGTTATRTVTFGETDQEDALQQQAGKGSGSFDSDAGKTRIGDSRYGWSIKYPSGVDKSYQSKKGDTVTLSDAKGEYTLQVRVKTKDHAYSKSALLKLLSDTAGKDGTILDRKVVDGAAGSYARIIGKDDYGYYEMRAYDHGDRLYLLALVIHSEKDYKNSTKRKGFFDILDSFSFTVDKKDKTLKDLAADEGGYLQYKQTDYGYTFSYPEGWTRAYDGSGRLESSGGTRYVNVYMASMADGDSLSDWAKRTADRVGALYTPDYIQSGSIEDTTLAGLPAKAWTVSVTLGDKWMTTRYYFAEKDGYKYRLEVGYPKDTPEAEANALVNKIKDSFQLREEGRNPGLGYMEDEEDLIDYSSKVDYKSPIFDYTLSVPEYWSQMAFPSYNSEEEDENTRESVTFSFTGGTLSIVGDRESTYDDVVKRVEKRHQDNKDRDSDYKVDEADIEYNGVPAKLFTLHYTLRKVPYEQKEIVFAQDGTTYVITQLLDDAVRTDRNVQALEDAVDSLRFTEE